ncbi:NUDIX domain-containing protein [bacterium]|nr:NUDIX domain-containing protein [bacterium]
MYKNKKFANSREKCGPHNSRSSNNFRPITSYGLILFTIVKNEPLFLLYQKRDNFEYMDLLRGLWKFENLPSMFSMMSPDERYRIRNYVFSELWDDLWVSHDSKIYKEGYHKASKKFETLKPHISNFLKTTQIRTTSSPWGFPKGKKERCGEQDIECALREFTEETHIPILRTHIICDDPWSELFEGSNKRTYETHYYIAKYDKPAKPSVKKLKGIRKEAISDEVFQIKWLNYEDACNHLTPKRKLILKRVMAFIAQHPSHTPLCKRNISLQNKRLSRD